MKEKGNILQEIVKRITATLLLFFLNINIFGAGIEVDSSVQQNVSVDKAPNGVPVINISTPSPKGTSVNSFKEFNVDSRGVEILNNTGVGRGYLSGIVNPNPNLRPGQEAGTVVFRVTGSNRSEIEGYISALSRRPINLFIANENGIYVNGGGFINVNRAGLVTGKINIQDGDIVSFTAKDGKVIIGEKGLDISDVERVDIITRTQELTGRIVGKKDINIILGQNEVSLAGIVTPITTSDNKPALALNAGALGSIYSNGQINIISTEKGVGVNLKSSVLSEESIRMKIKGNADIKEVISRNVEIASENLDSEKINGNSISIKAEDIENRKEITGQNVDITARNFKNNEITAGNFNLTAKDIRSKKIASDRINIKGDNLYSESMEGQDTNLIINNNANSKNILSNNLNITARNLKTESITAGKIILKSENTESKTIRGNTVSITGNSLKTDEAKARDIDFKIIGDIRNTGSILAENLNMTGKNIDSNKITANNFNLKAAGDIRSNEIYADKADIEGNNITSNEMQAGILKLKGNNIHSGTVKGNTLNITGNSLRSNIAEAGNIELKINKEIHNTGSITANNLDIKSGNIESNKIAADKLDIKSDNLNSKEITAGKATIKSKNINSDKIISNNLGMETESFVNNEKVDATIADIKVYDDFDNKGTVSTDKLKISSKNLINEGKILSGNADITTSGNIINSNILNAGTLNIRGEKLENGKEIKANSLNAVINQETVNRGTITANSAALNSKTIVNNGKTETENLTLKTEENIENNGQILSNNLTVNSSNFINNNELSVDKGTINADSKIINNNKINANDLATNSLSLENNKKIETGKGTFITAEDIENKDLIAGNELKFKGRNLKNGKGKTIYATQKIEAEMKGSIENAGAEILSQKDITLTADKIDNTVGKIRGGGDVKLTGRKIENVGETKDLSKYKVYWETWNGIRFNSAAEVYKGWVLRPRETNSGSTEDKEAVFEYFLSTYGGKGKVSYIFNELKDTVRQKKYTEQGDITAGSAEYPVTPLVNKIESEAKTTHAVISGKNITYPRIVHRVTIDENNPIKMTDGAEKLNWWKSKHHGKSRYPVNYERFLVVSPRVAYVSGQPSVIEGKEVEIDRAKIVTERYESARGEILKRAGNQGNISGQNIETVKNVTGIKNILNTGIISVNIGSLNISGIDTQNEDIGSRRGISIGSLYIPATDPSSKYIVENRTEFITRGNYYGGEYFLERMGYREDWDRVKLLGDAYYDNLLIEQTLIEKLGTRLINGISGSELTRRLIDNATTAKEDLKLRQGVALTKEQINSLKNDIIWYEYETVNGKKALVPKIYLSKATMEKLEVDGRSRIYGTEKTIIRGEGEFENRGLRIGSLTGVTEIRGDRIKNLTVTNERGEIVGKTVKIEAIKGDIENIGGKIAGVEGVELVAKKGNIFNDATKERQGFNLGENNHTEYETIGNIGEITGKKIRIEGKDYNSTGGALVGKEVELDLKGNINEKGLELKGNDRFGDEKNNQTYKSKEYVGAGIVAEKIRGKVNEINLEGSAFIAEDGKGLTVGKVNAVSEVNEYDKTIRGSSKGSFSKRSSYTESHNEENVASNFKIGANANITGTLNAVGSNIHIGDNSYIGGKVTTDARELHNSYYHEENRKGFSVNRTGSSITAGYGKTQNTNSEKNIINAKSSLHIGHNTVLNKGAEITATDFEHGRIEINNGDVVYGARKDVRETKTTSKSSYLGVTAGVRSPILDRARQAGEAAGQIRRGDKVGGAVNAVNFVTGTITGLAGNQGNRQTSYDQNGSVGKSGVKDALANNDFYANINVNVGFTKSKNESSSHEESAVVTTIRGLDENSSITYNNVKNITYKGTQAKDTKFIYNNVENINKEAVELHNTYRTNSKSSGVNTGVTVGYGQKVQTKGNGVSFSTNRSHLNTDETIYYNGNFNNVDEVHNNTKNMRLIGFNQTGGKVTGNIENLEITSVQNKSTTTGSSSGINVGVSSTGTPNSISVSGSKTNGNRTYVDNQSTFILGEGSNLTVGKTTNTGAIVGTKGENSRLKIKEYTGKDLYNTDTLKTTGGSIGLQTGKNPVTGVDFNQDKHDKEGITRNTVIGNVEIETSKGSPINTDLSKVNETTKDTHSSTNIYVEGQTIRAITNPEDYKKDIDKAKQEITDIGRTIKEAVNDRGDDNRNFFGQLSETRLSETLENIAGERLKGARDQQEIGKALEDAYRDLGYKAKIIYTDPKNDPQLIGKDGKTLAGTAYVGKDGIHTILVNTEADENGTRSGIIGTIVEEGSHIVGKVEGRQKKTGTEELGLESTGRATNQYFQDKYKDNDIPIKAKSDGKDYSSRDFGEHVGDTGGACSGKMLKSCIKYNNQFVDKVNKVDQQGALRSISFIADFTTLGTPKGIIEGITGKDLLTGEELNLLSRVLGLLPLVKYTYKGAKIGLKLLKTTEKAELVLDDGTKIVLKSDEVAKFAKGAKNSGKNIENVTENVVKDITKNHRNLEEGAVKVQKLSEKIKDMLKSNKKIIEVTKNGQKMFYDTKTKLYFYADKFHTYLEYEVFDQTGKHLGVIKGEDIIKNSGNVNKSMINTAKVVNGRRINVK